MYIVHCVHDWSICATVRLSHLHSRPTQKPWNIRHTLHTHQPPVNSSLLPSRYHSSTANRARSLGQGVSGAHTGGKVLLRGDETVSVDPTKVIQLSWKPRWAPQSTILQSLVVTFNIFHMNE